MNDRMIEVLRLIGFSLDAKGRWVQDIPENNFTDATKYVVLEEEDSWTGSPCIRIGQELDEEIDSSSTMDLSTFILLNFE